MAFPKKGAKPNPFAKKGAPAKGAKPNPFAKGKPAFKKGGSVKKGMC